MYREEDLTEIKEQLRKRRIAVLVPAAALLILSAVSFALRWPQLLTAAFTFLAVGVLAFCQFLLISPVSAYRQHIDHALHGKTHTTEGVFVSMEADTVTREGLALYPFFINVGAGIRDDGNRLFYYDANLPRPEWKEGQRLMLTSYDNRVVDWTEVRIKA